MAGGAEFLEVRGSNSPPGKELAGADRGGRPSHYVQLCFTARGVNCIFMPNFEHSPSNCLPSVILK